MHLTTNQSKLMFRRKDVQVGEWVSRFAAAQQPSSLALSVDSPSWLMYQLERGRWTTWKGKCIFYRKTSQHRVYVARRFQALHRAHEARQLQALHRVHVARRLQA